MRNLFENPVIRLVLVLLIVVIFGVKKLPDAARSLGRSMRIFKSEVKEMKDDGKDHAPGRSPLDGRVVDGQRAEQGAGTFDGQRRGA